MRIIKKIIAVTLLALITSINASAQGVKAYMKDGSVIDVPYAEMDSMKVTSQKIYSNTLKAREYTVNGCTFKMIPVEGNEKISDFYICETETTWDMWYAVMGGGTVGADFGDYPVQPKSWDDAQDFVTQLNYLTGEKFRLPTEDEWEFAASGGNFTHGYSYAGSNTANEVAWSSSNSPNKTHKPVKKLKPNELGTYDMSGNADEWIQDCYYGCTTSCSHNMRVRKGGSVYWGLYTITGSRPNSQGAQSSGFRIAKSM